MIHVQRHQTDETGAAIQPNRAWFRLAAKRTATAIGEQGEHEADPTVYAHPEVRKALERLFRDKCAYCERKIESWDVDHFRPKGRVAEREDHPGYFWLTYEWRNLYPACQHCNRRRKDRPSWGDAVELPTGGKADQFPLADESTRAMTPEDDVNREQRLLIDPCMDDPEVYFAYDPFGQIFSLKDPQGSKTIEVFHLSRRRLNVFRREVIVVVICVKKLIAKLSVSASRHAADDLKERLAEMKKDGSPHTGVVRYVANHPTAFGI